MQLTPLKAIKKHQPRLGVESRRVVWNVQVMKRKECGNARLLIVFCIPIGSVLIQTEKDALFGKMPLQRKVLKKSMVMYLVNLFKWEMNVERQESFRNRKLG